MGISTVEQLRFKLQTSYVPNLMDTLPYLFGYKMSNFYTN